MGVWRCRICGGTDRSLDPAAALARHWATAGCLHRGDDSPAGGSDPGAGMAGAAMAGPLQVSSVELPGLWDDAAATRASLAGMTAGHTGDSAAAYSRAASDR